MVDEGRGAIVCGVDASDEAVGAIRVSERLATALGRRLVLVHAGRDLSLLPRLTPIGVSFHADARERLRDAALEAGQGLLDEQRATAGAGDCEARVLLGEPASVLVRFARDENASAIVMGSRGRGPVAGAVLGSASAQVIASSPCPVVIVPPGVGETWAAAGTAGTGRAPARWPARARR
ncbi:MAG TPA: universal stress protein [Miltoncostaeaceae bacterium]|nr:universal stress protein [Miltoncostaeaceae bacterium]